MQHVIVDVAWGDFLDFCTYKLDFYPLEITGKYCAFPLRATFKYKWEDLAFKFVHN